MNINTKVEEALEILRAVGVPVMSLTARRKERLALALLALANLKPTSPWREAAIYYGRDSWSLKTRDIIEYWNTYYNQHVSSGSYDDVRRQELIILVEAGIVLRSAGNPNKDTNDPTRGYAISPDAEGVLRLFSEPTWENAVKTFKDKVGSLKERLERNREREKVPVRLPDGQQLSLSPGTHNQIQKAIIEEFLPRFVKGAEVLYAGDTAKKILVLQSDRLKELGFPELAHETLPDIVAYDPEHNWIFLIEAVHSSNPISQMRHLVLERMTKDCKAPCVYVSVFENRRALRQWLLDVSWETEVWIVDEPDHMIHFDGESFLGPYK